MFAARRNLSTFQNVVYSHYCNADYSNRCCNEIKVNVGSISQFKDLFRYLMELSENRKFTLIIDEFQVFHAVNPSVYSEMQKIYWPFMRLRVELQNMWNYWSTKKHLHWQKYWSDISRRNLLRLNSIRPLVTIGKKGIRMRSMLLQ